jgi:DTW domain-containing protein
MRELMSRRANVAARCFRCHLHQNLCLCALIPRIETRTKLVLVIHRAEDRKPTNTGRLAAECLVHSEVLVRGNEEAPSAAMAWGEGEQPLLLFPSQDAHSITRYADCVKPVTLIVPDGNWRQASKVRNRVPGLAQVPCVTLPAGEPSTYRLRSEAHPTGLATMEAIARAFGIVEGGERGHAVQRKLEAIFQIMVERTLWCRGLLPASGVTGGVPEGAERHEPRGGR